MCDKENENNAKIPQTETINEFGQNPMPQRIKNPRGTIHCIQIIGQIEGHMVLPQNNKTTKYEHIIPQLAFISDNPEIDGLLVILNTVGGDVEAGLAIAEMISTLGKPTVSLVLGGGHSIGVPLAVAAQYSYIAPSASMTLHPIRMNGTFIGVPQTYEYLDKIQERINDFIIRNTGISKLRLKELMMDTEQLARDIGTMLNGKEAVAEKLISEIGGLDKAINKLYELISSGKKDEKKD